MARLGDLDTAIEAFHTADLTSPASSVPACSIISEVTSCWKGNLSEAAATLTVASDKLALFDPVSETKGSTWGRCSPRSPASTTPRFNCRG